ncbi:hypothetical protein HO173_010896 [Letharia columbiana]|uniref:Uncharacterized protein n=1 Tax=Letharia columbiana TaxID=112416 RepID=A0A8H6FLP0_9LECA|nr:uncharacterized protein HO173_010896 [Letharia columbiana]KAF6230780.1 hypothetical protein HO173_010896 [Letharia columbiana]
MLNVSTLGNAAQLVILIIALIKHQIAIVQTSIISAVISNSVLMVGIGFLFGGMNPIEHCFNPFFVSDSLVAFSVAALLLLTAMETFARSATARMSSQNSPEGKPNSYCCLISASAFPATKRIR